MLVNNQHYHTVWMDSTSGVVSMIEQNLLPFEFQIIQCKNYLETCEAIKVMTVRGAGAIGATAGFAMAQAFLQGGVDVIKARQTIEATRPTAYNLFYATEKVFNAGLQSVEQAVQMSQFIWQEDIDACKKIGDFGAELLSDGMTVLTHCNAGWLAFVDYGTALSPIYRASEQGKKITVYADETRPRGQGARLTAWELGQNNIPHQVIPDNAAAFYMQKGVINAVIVGADRIACNGDAANKIGTLEKAICAKAFGIPFYVAAPFSTIDKTCPSGDSIIIEERTADEVLYQTGPTLSGSFETIRVVSPGSTALNPGFDVTPAQYITGIITEKGIIKPSHLHEMV